MLVVYFDPAWVPPTPNVRQNMLFNVFHAEKLKKEEKAGKFDAKFSKKVFLSMHQNAGSEFYSQKKKQYLECATPKP